MELENNLKHVSKLDYKIFLVFYLYLYLDLEAPAIHFLYVPIHFYIYTLHALFLSPFILPKAFSISIVFSGKNNISDKIYQFVSFNLEVTFHKDILPFLLYFPRLVLTSLNYLELHL
uniref:Uncharacterized protein n=1 Tax=Cacopsylla melanoneura TaxID=428564 RepID=A0A8D8ZDM2_9HEMI